MKNWKTTLAGLALALPSALTASGILDPSNKWASLISMIGAIALGFTAKDNNVTGGTIGQDDKEGRVATKPAI